MSEQSEAVKSSPFDSLKVGDKVVIITGYSRSMNLGDVSSITKTQVVVGSQRFRRSDGYLVGEPSSAWGRTKISTDQASFVQWKFSRSAFAFERTKLEFSKSGVQKIRAAADAAEKALREFGKWTEGES
jgi:hypothetical protein